MLSKTFVKLTLLWALLFQAGHALVFAAHSHEHSATHHTLFKHTHTDDKNVANHNDETCDDIYHLHAHLHIVALEAPAYTLRMHRFNETAPFGTHHLKMLRLSLLEGEPPETSLF